MSLALLLLGQRNEERPMKVRPWNQYQLVEQAVVPDSQLASRRNRVPCGCASICFGRTSAGTDGSFPPKVGPVQQPETSNPSLTSDKNVTITGNDNGHGIERKTCLKNNLKRHPENDSFVSSILRDSAEVKAMSSGGTVRRKVQWTDACGRELAQIREFECRWAMFGFGVGLLTEYATGSDFVQQLKILLSNFGIVDLD